MSGLVKAKKYDWKDSNMALFGSDTEKKVKKESAECEPAWQGSGQEVGLQIWRIVKFKVEDWPKENYGEFFTGDSYIILNTYKEEESDELLYDVHFWIGKYSTQDEYGTAAYKTVELDTFHDDKPIQHREVQGHESALFQSYFDSVTYLKGGADTGFRRVTPEAYKPRLFKFARTDRRVVMTEVSLKRSNLDDGDVYILDLGLQLYQWNGNECNKDEKFKATQKMQQICSERGGKPEKDVLEQRSISESHPFYESLVDEDDDEDDKPDAVPEGDKVLKKVSDADGSLDLEDVKTGEISRDYLCSDDVFIIDTKADIFVWVGKGASIDERRNGMTYAHHPFYESLVDEDDDEDDKPDAVPEGDKVLKKVSDADGSLDLEDVKTGEISRDYLCSDDVFIIDTKADIFVWVGKGASIDERRNGMTYAHNYLQGTDYPFLPITVIAEGKESQNKAFLDSVPGCA